MSEFIGRQEAIGVGIEATPGTAVAPQLWVRHLSNGFKRQATKLTNESAMGRVEKINDSQTDQTWAEGNVQFKLQDISIGYFLTSLFGSPVTTDNADSNPVVKDHTFDVAQTSNAAKTLTIAVKNGASDRRYPLTVVDELSFEFGSGQWVTVSAPLKSKSGATATNTVAYVDENEFSGKNVSIKLASNLAGLAGATALDAVSGTFTLSRTGTPYIPLGASEPSSFNTAPFEVNGEITLRYATTAFEDDWYSNAAKAFQIQFLNSDVTIGASAKPSLTFTAPKARISTFDRSDPLDEIIEQTIGIEGQLSAADGYMIRALLTNTQAGYTA